MGCKFLHDLSLYGKQQFQDKGTGVSKSRKSAVVSTVAQKVFGFVCMGSLWVLASSHCPKPQKLGYLVTLNFVVVCICMSGGHVSVTYSGGFLASGS